MAKKKAKAKFDDDVVSNQIISKYGDIVEQGTKVLADLQNFNTIGVSPALDLALGGGLREGSVVVMTGDIFDSSRIPEEEVITILNRLAAPVFFVMGNHERYGRGEKVTKLLAKTKVKILRNEKISFKGIEIIGIDDTGSDEAVAEKLSKIEISESGYSVLLHHRPTGIEAAVKAGIDLMVCGHTHNGQIFPFNYIVGLFHGHMKGLYRYGDFHLYVSPGTGTWGPRMRLGSKSEIVLFELGRE